MVESTKSLSDTVPIKAFPDTRAEVLLVKVSNGLNFWWREHIECYRVIFQVSDSEAIGS